MAEKDKKTAALALSDHRQAILSDWEKKVRAQIKEAANLPHPLIIDTVPAFLDNLAEALSEDHPRNYATETSTISQEHGGERARLTRYNPDHLIREFQLLRDTILEYIQREVQLTPRDWRVFQISFDKSIQESMLAYFLIHNRLREQFVAGLGHDLRNPLGAAKISAELILLATKADLTPEGWDDVRGLAQRIVSIVKRADRLIQDLLDATAIQIGDKVPLRMVEAEMLALVRSSIADFARPQQQRLRVKGETIWGFWDEEAIRRAIENLISNAIKYGKKDSLITLEIKQDDQRVILCVHNEGSYIPAEEQEGLFQPFRRSESARNGKSVGWGLGLALVRSVAEGHGGSIGVESSINEGTTFLIDMPVDARPFQKDPAE